MPSWAYRDISVAHAAAERERRADRARRRGEGPGEVAPHAHASALEAGAGREALARSHRMRLRLNATFVFEGWCSTSSTSTWARPARAADRRPAPRRRAVLRPRRGRQGGGKPLVRVDRQAALAVALRPAAEPRAASRPTCAVRRVDEALGESLFRDLAEHLRGLRHYSEVHVDALRAWPTRRRCATASPETTGPRGRHARRRPVRESPFAARVLSRGGRGVARPRRCGQPRRRCRCSSAPAARRPSSSSRSRLSVKVGGQACPSARWPWLTPSPACRCAAQELLLRMNRTVLSDRAAGVLLPFIYLLERDRDAGQTRSCAASPPPPARLHGRRVRPRLPPRGGRAPPPARRCWAPRRSPCRPHRRRGHRF